MQEAVRAVNQSGQLLCTKLPHLHHFVDVHWVTWAVYPRVDLVLVCRGII